MAEQAKHQVTVAPGTPERGVTARLLLQQRVVKQTQIRCPRCGQDIAVPGTLEPQVRALAARLGGDTAYVRYAIFHPADIPARPGYRTMPLNSPEAQQQSGRAVHDLPKTGR